MDNENISKILKNFTELLEQNNNKLLEYIDKKFKKIENIICAIKNRETYGNSIEGVAKEIKSEQSKLIKRVESVGEQVKKVAEHKTDTAQQLLIDELTGARNRLGFQNKFEEELFLAKRYQHPMSIVMFDIDDFKEKNDTYGHQAGDFVLVEIVKIVRANIRSIDFIARYGGEEFILVFPETPSKAAFNLADRLRSIIMENDFKYKDNINMEITISGGIATYPDNGSDSETLIKVADKKLYSAKKNGKNKIIV